MKTFNCIRCKWKLPYVNSGKGRSILLGYLMAHNQMVHGISPVVWFFQVFGIDPWELGIKV